MPQKNSRTKTILNILSNALLVAGLLMIALSIVLMLLRFNPRRLNFNVAPLSPEKATLSGKKNLPVYITFAGTTMNLPVIPSKIENGIWETTDKGVSYLALSPVPGEVGNSIMYGHNWTDLLGDLTKVKPGQTIRIRYKDQSQKTFVVENTAMVSPKNTAILLPSKEPLLTIYTCAGLFDTKRFVVTARPLSS